MEVTASVSAISEATPTQLAANAKAKSSDGTSLASAAAARAIYTRTFEQWKKAVFTAVPFGEKHNGRVYFDKAGHVWSTTSTYGYKGYHNCDLGNRSGFTIKVTSCSVEQRYDLNGPAISLWDYFQVHVVAHGFPFSLSTNMHANAYDGGTITFP